MQDTTILKKFRSNIPNIPEVQEFERPDHQKEKRQPEQDEFRGFEVIGPILPDVNYSDESDDDEEVERDQEELNYEPPPYKQVRMENLDTSDSDDDINYIDHAALSRDPALASIIQSKSSKLHKPERIRIRPDRHDYEIKQSEDKIEIELPVSHQLILKGHSRTVTSLAIDNPGSRLCSGGYDYQTRLWDFPGMDKTMHSFRVIEPFEGHAVCQVSWAKDCKQVLCICGHSQAYLMDREGKRVLETLKGDMYLNDTYKTMGHIATINAGQFHPDSSDHFLTCSDDGTVRLFDVNQKLWGICQHLPHKQIVKCHDIKGQKTVPTQIGLKNGVNLCLAGCQDGSIQCFQLSENCLGINRRPQIMFREAHKPTYTINCISMLEGGRNFISNSNDNTIKLWDLRNPSRFVEVQYFKSNFTPPTKMALNKDETLMVTADHHFNKMQKLEYETDLVFYNTKNLKEYARVPAFDTAITDIVWHPILNQIFAGGMNGDIYALFNPRISRKGCMLCIAREVKHIHAEMMEYQREIIAPQGIPLFKEFQVRETTKLIIKKDDEPYRSTKPEMPLTGPGKGGKIAGASTVTQFVMRTLHEQPVQEDARQALLDLDKETRLNPRFVLQAYSETQPKAIFDYSEPQQEQNFILDLIKVVCKHCGMKICACKRKVVP